MPTNPPLGFVATIPTPNLAPGARQLLSITARVNAGQTLSQQISGDFIYTESVTKRVDGTLAVLSILTDKNPALVLSRPGREIHLPTQFSRVQFVNATPDDIIFVGFIGFGEIFDYFNGVVQTVGSAVSNGGLLSGFTRPNNVVPYAINQAVSDAVGNPFTFSIGARVPGGSVILRRIRCYKNSTTIANAKFRLFMGTSAMAPVPDQTAFPLVFNDLSTRIMGLIDLPVFVTGGAGSDSALCEIDGIDLPMTIPSPLTFFSGQLVALAPYVPAALEQFVFEAFFDQY